MQYAVSPKRMRALEQHAFSMGVSALLLMEQAAQAVVEALENALNGVKNKRILIVCGAGNNGGDGLAAARLLLNKGCNVTVWLLGEPKTEEARVNLAYLKALAPNCASIIISVPDITGFDAIVDAIFGTGFHDVPDGLNASAINQINVSAAPVRLSVDIPSGMNGEAGRCSASIARCLCAERQLAGRICRNHGRKRVKGASPASIAGYAQRNGRTGASVCRVNGHGRRGRNGRKGCSSSRGGTGHSRLSEGGHPHFAADRSECHVHGHS